MTRVNVWPSALVVICGCAEANEGSPDRSSVTDSAGVAIVTNDPGPSEATLGLEETLRLGVLDGGGPEEFSRIFAVALGPDGSILVGNHGSRTARLFSSEGEFRVEVGGRGDGPAETTSVNDVLMASDTIVVIDWQRGGKAVLFTADGEYVTNRTFRNAEGRRVIPAHRTSDEWLARVYREERLPDLGPGEPALQTYGVHTFDWHSDSLGPELFEVPTTLLYGVGGAEGGVDWGLLPETWHAGFDAAGRLYVTHEESYRIDVHDPSGLVRSIRRLHESRPFGGSDVDDIRSATLHVIDTMSMIPDEARPGQRRQLEDRIEAQARLPQPEQVPPIGGLLVSPDGSFWIERADLTSPVQSALRRTFGFGAQVPVAPTRWELFDPDGVYVGALDLPARFRPDAIDGRTVLGVYMDDLDVEYVVRYRVVASAG